jgi:hypothetical protein
MSDGRRGVNLHIQDDRFLYVSKPLFFYFFIVIVFIILIFFLSSHSNYEIKLSDAYPIFKNRDIFSHLNKAAEISYTIKLRANLDRNGVHRIYFQVDVPEGASQEQIITAAQKIVKEGISQEFCHGVRIDFGRYGHVDFAPFGDWGRAGEIPVNQYKNYRFNYFFSSLFSMK